MICSSTLKKVSLTFFSGFTIHSDPVHLWSETFIDSLIDWGGNIYNQTRRLLRGMDDQIQRSWVRFVRSPFPSLVLTLSRIFMGPLSTVTYTRELILWSHFC